MPLFRNDRKTYIIRCWKKKKCIKIFAARNRVKSKQYTVHYTYTIIIIIITIFLLSRNFPLAVLHVNVTGTMYCIAMYCTRWVPRVPIHNNITIICLSPLIYFFLLSFLRQDSRRTTRFSSNRQTAYMLYTYRMYIGNHIPRIVLYNTRRRHGSFEILTRVDISFPRTSAAHSVHCVGIYVIYNIRHMILHLIPNNRYRIIRLK